MHHGPLRGLTIKAALILGFGLTLGLWLFIGFQSASEIAEGERRSSAVASRYVKAQDLLASLRTHVLTASGAIRDAVLAGESVGFGNERDRIDEAVSQIGDALGSYLPVLESSAEERALARLRSETDLFATTIRELLTDDAGQNDSEGRTRLNATLFPRRTAVLRATEELQAINRAAFIQYQADLAGRHGAAERATWRRLGIALALSLSIAIVATLYASRLERRLLAQLAKDALNTRALQLLATKLINAQEAERGRIARELHDDVGQALTAIKVELAVAQRRIEIDGGSGDLLEPAQLITDGALQTVRDLSHLLHPVALDDLGLAAAVDSYLRDFSKRTAIRVHLQQDDMTGRLAPEIEVAAYRIIQEALTNVARHAEASVCRVSLRRSGDMLVVSVDDDGRGFDPSKLTQSPRSGLGLLGMRERVSQLGGSVLLTSVIGQGTTVRIECPATRRDESPSIEAAEAASSELRPQSAHG